MKPFIRWLRLKNFLSYGREGASLHPMPLNVLIGPNASGKSNLLEVLAIFRAAAGDLQAHVRTGGGIGGYLWRGGGGPSSLEALIDYPQPSTDVLRYQLELVQVGGRMEVGAELVQTDTWDWTDLPVSSLSYRLNPGEKPVLIASGTRLDLVAVDELKISQSILAQRRDPERYPDITFLANQFGSIALFQEWNFGRRSPARLPQPTDLPSDFLLPDASNLGLVLHDLGQTSSKRDELIVYLRKFYEAARYISTKIQGGALQLFVEEEGNHLVPATRLSDGTLRFLCLLAILCHPNPPPVIGIEEPELGLHPDILPTVAELLRKASERTQLFVTTHSDALVSALSDTPESILVCEGTPDGTTMKRLDAEQLKAWLADYSLGELWRMGEIGGNRW